MTRMTLVASADCWGCLGYESHKEALLDATYKKAPKAREKEAVTMALPLEEPDEAEE